MNLNLALKVIYIKKLSEYERQYSNKKSFKRK